MSISEQILLFSIALVANGFSAFAGGGAGLIQFPALLFLGLPFSVALATHKLATVALGLGAALRHSRENYLSFSVSLLAIMAGLPGVVLGARTILDVPEQYSRGALGVLTICLGCYSFFKKEMGLKSNPRTLTPSSICMGAFGFFAIGFLNGSLSSGTGLFVTLFLVSFFGFDYKTAVAHTLTLVGIAWNASGALTLGMLSELRWDWLPALVAGSLIGGYAGAHFSVIKGSAWVRIAFIMLTLTIGIKLLYDSLVALIVV